MRQNNEFVEFHALQCDNLCDKKTHRLLMKSHEIFKGLRVKERSWTNADGTVQHKFRAYIYQPEIKRRTEITLDATSLEKAKREATEVWSKYQVDIANGKDISERRRNLPFFIKKFLEYQKIRASLGEITAKRTNVTEHCLKSLTEFWVSNRKLDLDSLTKIYDQKFVMFRSKQTARLTNRPITPRTINAEMQVHRQFINWCIQNDYCSRRIESRNLNPGKANYPFPNDKYVSLLRVARTDIESTENTKWKWSKVNYYFLILLMNGIGCRVVETKNMKWSDIEERKDGVRLYIHGKNKERTIYLPPRIYKHLMKLKAFKAEKGKLFGWNEKTHPYIFSAYKSEEPPKQFDAELRRNWIESCGVGNARDFEWVCFRHKFITNALNNNVHSLYVAKYTGTSQLMIERTYQNLISKDVYDLVFKDAPEEAMQGRDELPKFLGLNDNESDDISLF